MPTILDASRSAVLPFLGLHQPVSALTHLIAALLALWGGYRLLRKGRGDGLRTFSLGLYAFTLFALFVVSGTYHALWPGPAKRLLHKLDYAAIFLLIAGSVTPVKVILFRGFRRWSLLAAVWAGALGGIALLTWRFRSLPFPLVLGLYLGLGWFGVFSARGIFRIGGWGAVRPLLYGGIAYSIGAVADWLVFPNLYPTVVGPHELFHIAVIVGAGYHWSAIHAWADQPTRERLELAVRPLAENLLVAKAAGERFLVFARSLPDLKRKLARRAARRFHPSLKPAEIVIAAGLSKEVLKL